MACTRSEFLGWLRAAAKPGSLSVQGGALNVDFQNGSVHIVLDEQPPRRLGAMTLPCLYVSFRFHDVDERARDAFLARFDLVSRRGGG